ncbi:MAG: hypothetical protein JRD89_02135 [Deltaproteobacteria bacterium]|nr:hypothetical protein [Deltaproteobacteria bacterium]
MERAHNFKDLTGRVFNSLTVIEIYGKKNRRLLWDCRCECGKIIQARCDGLMTGRPKACKSCSQKARFAGPKLCNGCKQLKNRSEYYKSKPYLCKECLKPILNEKNKTLKRRQRLEALRYYGGSPPKCDCCGEGHIEFLTFDHIGGGGNKHRKAIGVRGSGEMVRWLIKNNFPKGFRVLCNNCNTAIGLHGYCPHQPVSPIQI